MHSDRSGNILNWDYSDINDDPVRKNEVSANQMTAVAFLCCTAVLITVWVMVMLDVIWYDKTCFTAITAACSVLMAVPAMICIRFRGRPGWIKYMLVLTILGAISILYVVVSVDALILIPLPMILSVRYFSRRLTYYAILFTYVLFLLAVIFNVLVNIYINVTVLDLTDITITVHGSLIDAIRAAAVDAYGKDYTSRVLNLELINDFIPSGLMLLLFSIICISAASAGKRILEEGVHITESSARLRSELKTASDIQLGMLPDRSYVNDEYELYCSMVPAKEVGGDLYDYFGIGDDRVALVIADVSGKGVPAALFMATAKALLEDNLEEMEPSEAVTRVSQTLCGNNKAGLFVTAWIGVMDIVSGRLTYVNAGHNPPLILHGTGDYEFLDSEPDVVLAAVDGYRYSQNSTDMRPGDRLFLYTDGITEARDGSGGFYGEDRLREFINSCKDLGPEQQISVLKDDIGCFSGDTGQFDDMTMLSFRYKSTGKEPEGHIFRASAQELPGVLDYICGKVKGANLPDTDMNMIRVCAEEIFVNIAGYAYPEKGGDVNITAEYSGYTLKIVFSDSGIPFDPLNRDDPDIDAPADERGAGGLGILITRTYFDRTEYEYSNNRNVLTLYKTWKVSE